MTLKDNIQRLQSIDALRGLVILIMLLDHVRETFYLHHQVPDRAGHFLPQKSHFSLQKIKHFLRFF